MRVIYQRLGIRSTKVPKDMHGEFNIDGWKVVVKRAGKDARGGKPRIFVRHNGDLIPAGRVRQALCSKDLYRARRRATRARGPKGRFRSRW